ncbi:hypothetical protein [Hydrogenophaga aquatica]
MEVLKHHELKAEWVEDKHGPAVMLTQEDGWGDEHEHSVIVHPYQLRHVCEHFGILAADEQSARAIATLRRRLLALCERIGDLEGCLTRLDGDMDADWSREMAKLDALADLAAEWREDLMPLDQEATRRADTAMQCAINVPAGAARTKQADLI